MNESGSEKYSRVQQMLIDNGGTWDLSPNDKAALRHVLGMINFLADELAVRNGNTIGDVFREAHRIVEKVQS